MNISVFFITASGAVIFTLGLLHLVFTFYGPRFDPRDPSLKLHMQGVSPVISSQTTMWRAWISFNATHSIGAMLYGLVYGYLALRQTEVLFKSWFLLAVGLALLASYVALGKRYWFSIPFRGSIVATVLYLLGLVTWFA